jgi:acetyl/propionyl-CoA carboxylase alpha subunit
VVGVATNIPYLQQILEMDDFTCGRFDTGFLDRHQVSAVDDVEEHRAAAQLAALLLLDAGDGSDRGGATAQAANGRHPVSRGSGWREQMGGVGAGKGAGRWPTSI